MNAATGVNLGALPSTQKVGTSGRDHKSGGKKRDHGTHAAHEDGHSSSPRGGENVGVEKGSQKSADHEGEGTGKWQWS